MSEQLDALKLALAALFSYEDDYVDDGTGGITSSFCYDKDAVNKAIAACRQALAQPVQEKPLFADIIAKHPGLAEELNEMDAAPVQEPAFKVGNLVTLTGGEYPGLGQWFVQLWDGDEIAARVYGDDREAINRRVAALNTPPAAQRPWIGLTDEEIDAVQVEYVRKLMPGVRIFAKDIEAKLKEKNT